MALDHNGMLDLYRIMTTIRNFEERGIPETGQRGMSASVHSSAGQEAVATGVCSQLSNEDYMGSTHRGHGHCIAVGAALTSKVKQLGRVAVAFFGDGGANQGILHESMNLASIWKLPVIFVCENNGYAMSTPSEYALSTAHVSDRAPGYDMPGFLIDGMDVFAVHDAAGEAVARAREGSGPTLLECETYRYYGHTVFDDPLTYRSKEEEDHWRARDPILHFRSTVLPMGDITSEELDQIDQEVSDLIEEAVKFADESPLPDPIELYDDVYVNYPVELLKRGVNMEI